MSKVLILTNSSIGLHRFRRELVEELLKNHKVFISLPDGECIDSLISMGCEFIDTPFTSRGTSISADIALYRCYKAILRKFNPDVVLTYTIKPNIYGGLACRRYKIPYISNITGLGTALENPGLLQKLTSLMYKSAMKKVNCLFFQNEENMLFFKKRGIAVARHKILPGSGVNLDHYSLLEYPPEGKLEFAYISRIMKEKGIDIYLALAEHIKKKVPHAVFHVCGDCDDDYKDVIAEKHSSGIINYTGHVDDVREILKMTHCTIHPSFYPEGMSNILLESAACGRPIITTDRSGCRETVDDGVNGYLVNSNQIYSIISKTELFISLPYEAKNQMGILGRQKAEKEYDRNKVIMTYVNEINTIIRN